MVPKTVVSGSEKELPKTEQSSFVYRERNEIIASILRAAKDQKGKTHLMYESDLDSRGLKKYLDFLISRDLIKPVKPTNNKYMTTPKGVRFLAEHEKLESLQRL